MKRIEELSTKELELLRTEKGLETLVRESGSKSLKAVMDKLAYKKTLKALQVELVKMQQWVVSEKKRLVLIYEGRDAAGKGGAIKRFTQHLMPRAARVVALGKPSDRERNEWYFQRYTRQLPCKGEIVLFDRSWYNRAVVEPVMEFCTEEQYNKHMEQIPVYERMLDDEGIIVVKFWFAVSKEEQAERLQARASDPLKQRKLSPVDQKAQEYWARYTHYVDHMIRMTHHEFCPWVIINGNNKHKARLESIRYVLNLLPYAGKEKADVSLTPDPKTAEVYSSFFRTSSAASLLSASRGSEV
jgi:polyphosphate kinase 2